MKKLIVALFVGAMSVPTIADAAIRSTNYFIPTYIRFGEVFGTTFDSILIRLPNNTTVAACDANPSTPTIESRLYIDAAGDPLRMQKANAYLTAIADGKEVAISYDDSTCRVAAVWVRS